MDVIFFFYLCHEIKKVIKSGIRKAVRRETRLCSGDRLQIYGFLPDLQEIDVNN